MKHPWNVLKHVVHPKLWSAICAFRDFALKKPQIGNVAKEMTSSWTWGHKLVKIRSSLKITSLAEIIHLFILKDRKVANRIYANAANVCKCAINLPYSSLPLKGLFFPHALDLSLGFSLLPLGRGLTIRVLPGLHKIQTQRKQMRMETQRTSFGHRLLWGWLYAPPKHRQADSRSTLSPSLQLDFFSIRVIRPVKIMQTRYISYHQPCSISVVSFERHNIHRFINWLRLELLCNITGFLLILFGFSLLDLGFFILRVWYLRSSMIRLHV